MLLLTSKKSIWLGNTGNSFKKTSLITGFYYHEPKGKIKEKRKQDFSQGWMPVKTLGNATKWNTVFSWTLLLWCYFLFAFSKCLGKFYKQVFRTRLFLLKISGLTSLGSSKYWTIYGLLFTLFTCNNYAATKLGFKPLYIMMNLFYMEKQLPQLQKCLV